MFNNLKTWWERPFSEDMDGVRWIAFLGFIIIIAIMWRSVIKLMQEIAQ